VCASVRECPPEGALLGVEESRIEPRFDRIARLLAGKPIKVRCWSNGDWARLIREEGSYTPRELGPYTLGFTGIGGSRVKHLPIGTRRFQRVSKSGDEI
jgi:hypothetical protein